MTISFALAVRLHHLHVLQKQWQPRLLAQLPVMLLPGALKSNQLHHVQLYL